MEERLRTMLRFETSFQKGGLFLSRRREALRMMLRFETSFQNGELCLSRRREGLRTMLRFKTPRRPKREKRTFSDFEKDCVRCYVLRRRFKREGHTFKNGVQITYNAMF